MLLFQIVWIYGGAFKHSSLYDESMDMCRFCLLFAIYMLTNSTDKQKGQTEGNLLLCSMTLASQGSVAERLDLLPSIYCRCQHRILTRFTLGELRLLRQSFPFPISCSFTATSCQSQRSKTKKIYLFCKNPSSSHPRIVLSVQEKCF